MPDAKGYSLAQISLLDRGAARSWLSSSMTRNHRRRPGARSRRRQRGRYSRRLLVTAHVVVGIAIPCLMLWRLGLRLTRGAPAARRRNPRRCAGRRGDHVLLYVLLGRAADRARRLVWQGGRRRQAARAQQDLLMLLVFLHIAGALYQRFVLKSDAVARILRPEG